MMNDWKGLSAGPVEWLSSGESPAASAIQQSAPEGEREREKETQGGGNRDRISQTLPVYSDKADLLLISTAAQYRNLIKLHQGPY